MIMVDFSYKRPVLEGMLRSGDVRQASTILILDHHKSAAEDLGGIEKPAGVYDPDRWRRRWEQNSEWPVRAEFDMERSGAGIAWDYFYPGAPRPRLIDHIEDRDLWRFRINGTREIQAAVFSYPYDFDVWDKLMDGDPMSLFAEGCAIERKHHKDIAELVAVTKRTMLIGGHVVPTANLPYTLTSDAGNLMAEGQPFAACYWDTANARVFSLRSRPEGLDVSEIAKQYDGGGHRNASGFSVPRDHELARS